jgi:hypothetical protein
MASFKAYHTLWITSQSASASFAVIGFMIVFYSTLISVSAAAKVLVDP